MTTEKMPDVAYIFEDVWNDKQWLDHCGTKYLRAEPVEALLKQARDALNGFTAATCMLIDSANSSTDLSEEGLANLLNVSSEKASEAITAIDDIKSKYGDLFIEDKED